MKISNGIDMLEISAIIMGKTDTIHPTLIWDEATAILVDTGYPGQYTLIREAIEKAGSSLENLERIIMTHQDLDHIGSLPVIVKESHLKIEVLANEIEKPYIQGEKKLIKLTPEAIAQIDSILPANVPEEWRRAFKAVLENPPKAQIDRTVTDAEELPYCGGIIVINTPGHTPGHISLYHKSSKTLIAGDALIVSDGQLLGPVAEQSSNIETAIKSLKKLTAFDIQAVICYHGGLYNHDVNRRIAELAQN